MFVESTDNITNTLFVIICKRGLKILKPNKNRYSNTHNDIEI